MNERQEQLSPMIQMSEPSIPFSNKDEQKPCFGFGEKIKCD